MASHDDVSSLIKVVGISAAGKSTLVRALRERGYNAFPVSQEHSDIPNLWQLYDEPRYLIYLSITLQEQHRRRPDVTWTKRAYRAEILRLLHARDNANLRIDTSALHPAAVLKISLLCLQRANFEFVPHPLSPITPTAVNRDSARYGQAHLAHEIQTDE